VTVSTDDIEYEMAPASRSGYSLLFTLREEFKEAIAEIHGS